MLYAKRWDGAQFVADLPEDAGQQGITGPVEPQGVALAVDPAGRPFVAWTDVMSGNPEVYLRANRFAVGQVYYVNDASTAADSLTTAAGSAEPGYDGRSPDKPMLSIQAVLEAYDLGPGDVVLVDAGTYPDGFTVGAADAGAMILGPAAHTAVIRGTAVDQSGRRRARAERGAPRFRQREPVGPRDLGVERSRWLGASRSPAAPACRSSTTRSPPRWSASG